MGGPGCGCGGLSLFWYRLICSDCGQVSTGEVVMPTSLEAGGVTTMFGSHARVAGRRRGGLESSKC